MDKGTAENFLAQFTSRETAETIVGDLVELSLGRRRGWFTRELIRVVVSFWVKSLRIAPGRSLCCVGLGLAVYAGVYAFSFIASGLPWYPWHRIHELEFLARLCVVAFVANLLTGALLARRLSPARAHAIASLAVLWVAASVLLPLFPWPFYAWPFVTHWPWKLLLAALVPLLYLAPLLIGAIVVQRRTSPARRSD